MQGTQASRKKHIKSQNNWIKIWRNEKQDVNLQLKM